jgi:hypothetical protein
VRGDDHDPEARRAGLQFFQQPDAVHLVHAQIGDDQVGAESIEDRQRLVRGLDGLDLVALGTQPDRQQPQQAGIVVDEQDFPLGTEILVGHEI